MFQWLASISQLIREINSLKALREAALTICLCVALGLEMKENTICQLEEMAAK